ncbi:MAG: hypothetical protein KC766_36825 [Myxococcales bacterium]|nr:hypothetical protein [Myxococcales bacterium]
MFPHSLSWSAPRKSLFPLLLVFAAGCGDAGSSNSGLGQGGSGQGGSGQGGSGQGGSGQGGDGFGGGLGVDSGAGDGGNKRCASGAEWIYLVDSNNVLLQFRPDSLTLTPIGNLNCPSSAGDTPFSMAVDRDATAWVLYQSGNIFHVDTSSAACSATSFQPGQAGLDNFGMGFVSNDDDDGESLFVAGGTSVTVGNATLASIDTQTLQLSTIGQINGWPELTGTGNGQLWAFSPNTTPPTIQRLDKTNGSVAESFNVNQLTGSPSAWAFAFWGGGFYVFLQRALENSTNIWFFDPGTQSLTQAVNNTGYRIVGAGVSTCAPLTPPA